MTPEFQPIPGILPPYEPGQRVRIVSRRVNLGAGESLDITALAFVAAPPMSVDGAWVVPVVGYGRVPVGDVEKVA